MAKSLWPFASAKKALINELEKDIKNLRNQVDESEDLEYSLKQLEAKAYGESDAGTSVLGTFGVVDEQLDKAQLQRLYATETWFFIAVNAIATDIAALPIKLEKRKIIMQSVQQMDGTIDKVRRETWIDASAEPEYKLLTKPNNIQTPVEFWVLVVIDLLATGDAFIYVDQGTQEDQQLVDENQSRNRLQQAMNKVRPLAVRGMYRINSSMVQPIASLSDKGILEGYSLQSDAGNFKFKPEEIIHIRLPNPTEAFFGLSPIVAVMKKLLLDRYTDEHMLRFYKQGARLGGVIKTGKKLTKEQLIRLERVFESNFTGKRNHHKTLVLPEGMEYQTIEQNPGETALIDFTKANKEPILAAFKVPPVKVGLLDGATYANAEIQDKTYYNNTIKPFCTYIEQAINFHGSVLAPLKELKMSFDMSAIPSLRENEVEKGNIAKGMLENGMSIDEVREKVWKLGPVPGGKVVPAVEKSKPAAPMFAMPEKDIKPTDRKTEVPNVQNDTATLSDVKPTGGTFEDRVGEIVSVAIANGIDPTIAVTQAIQQTLKEGFLPTAHEVTSEVETNGKKWGRFTQSEVQDHLTKTTGEGVAPLIEAYQTNVEALFDRMEKFFLKFVKKNKSWKSYNYKIKADDGTPDVDFLSDYDIDLFVDGEIETYTKDQWAAMRKGFSSALPSSPLTFPNERAKKKLEQIGTQHLKSITGTAKDRVKEIIIEAYEKQTSVTEIASLLRDEFMDMKANKANMIARTETLTAVSMGQREKVEEFKIQYPEAAQTLKKVWVSAQDDRVRDSHADLDGIAIGVDETFDNGLLYPRDPKGAASEVINCRCTTIEYLAEDEDAVSSNLSDTSPLADAVQEAEKSYKKIIKNKYAAELRLAIFKKILKGGPGSGPQGDGSSHVSQEEIKAVAHTFDSLSKEMGSAATPKNISDHVSAAGKSQKISDFISKDENAPSDLKKEASDADKNCKDKLSKFIGAAKQYDEAKTYAEKDSLMPTFVNHYKNLAKAVDGLEKVNTKYDKHLRERM